MFAWRGDDVIGNKPFWRASERARARLNCFRLHISLVFGMNKAARVCDVFGVDKM